MWFADRQIGPSLLQFGSPDQRRRWLPGILDGSSMWCIGMSEPDNGSDVAGLRTRALRDGDDWIVTGQKVWTSGAAVGDWIYLIVRTDPDAPAHAGLSDLVVDLRAPGTRSADRRHDGQRPLLRVTSTMRARRSRRRTQRQLPPGDAADGARAAASIASCRPPAVRIRATGADRPSRPTVRQELARDRLPIVDARAAGVLRPAASPPQRR
jgi:hypothetical protein